MSIEIRNVSKQFGDFQALRNVSVDVDSGELVALLGPSGCGKTTLLRIIAGLETADTGSILFAGEDTTDVHVRERQVGFVFQHYALFRHMTVFENVAFGLRVKPRGTRPGEAQIKAKVHDLLKLVQLDWLADRYPAQLSGGQRQRIALARALAVEPKVLLLDEPFGALDAKVRKELRRWLRRLHDELHVASIFVTHDQEEALEVADRVVLMNSGQIEQVGSPARRVGSPGEPVRLWLSRRRESVPRPRARWRSACGRHSHRRSRTPRVAQWQGHGVRAAARHGRPSLRCRRPSARHRRDAEPRHRGRADREARTRAGRIEPG